MKRAPDGASICPVEQADVEGAIEGVYRVAGLEPDEARSPALIALRLFGPGAIEPVVGMRVAGALSTVQGRRIIAVRKGLPKTLRSFVVGHELGHWWCEREGYSGDDIERVCDAIGAGLMTPRPAYRRALRAHGEDWTQLALAFHTTESMVALRFGEITRTPLALIAPATLRIRGEVWGWPPDEGSMRRLARLPPPPGLRRARLRDDPRRVVLEADDLEACG